jgi:hypothetical protein
VRKHFRLVLEWPGAGGGIVFAGGVVECSVRGGVEYHVASLGAFLVVCRELGIWRDRYSRRRGCIDQHVIVA